MSFNNNVFIYGCCGALGRNLTKFLANKNIKVLGCDFTTNFEAHSCLSIPKDLNFKEQANHVEQFLKMEMKNNNKLDAIICTSGGFTFGNNADEDFIAKSQNMNSSTIEPSIICAHLAAKYLKNSGVLVLPGAAAAFEPNASLLPYAASKAYVHYLIKSLASSDTGMPTNSKILGIAPVTLDTDNNRLSMPNSDFSSWTSLDFVSNQILSWITKPNDLITGSIFKFNTIKGKTTLEKF